MTTNDQANGFDDEAREELREQRLRTLGTRTPRCTVSGCTESDPLALTGAAPDIVCREHLADAHGRSWIENHHVDGAHNDPYTIPLPANDHGVVSELQELWPRQTLRNPDGSPLLQIAAMLRGMLVILRLVVDRAAVWIPAALELLDALLCDRLGPGWWNTLGWQP